MAHEIMRGVLKHGLPLFLIIASLERWYRVRISKYKSRNFFHDMCYWLYGRSGILRILFTAWWFSLLADKFAFLSYPPLQSLPVIVQISLSLIVVDLSAYWIHRWQHSSRVLWAFHSVHHSQEQLSFVTSARIHPVDNLVLTTLAFFPILVLGPTPEGWLPAYLVMEFLIALQHSEIPWRYGPLYRLVVSPSFHAYHHSTDSAHHNRHYGRMLSIWDFVFGTAVHDEKPPTEYGLTDRKMPTLVSQIGPPFLDAYRELRSSLSARFGERAVSSPAANPPAD